jgi:hypothetical protein
VKKSLLALLAIVTLALLFSTCKTEETSDPVTVDECIDNFMSAINSSDRSDLYECLSPKGDKYNEAKAASYWETYFPVGETYKLSGESKDLNDNDSGFVDATITSGTTYDGGYNITFGMTKDSDDNSVMSSIYIAGSFGSIYK